MAIEFNGADRLINCGSSATLDNIRTLTYAAWVNPFTLSSVNRIIDKGQILLSIHDTDVTAPYNKLRLFQNWSVTNGQWETSASVFTTGVWQHCCVTYDGNSSLNIPEIYFNGTSQARTTVATPTGVIVDDAANLLGIGGSVASSGSLPMNGQMEDVRIFGRIITDNEVAMLANGYRGPLGGEVGWWPLGDSSTLSAEWEGLILSSLSANIMDRSNNTNDGTPTNSPVGRAGDAPRMGAMI